MHLTTRMATRLSRSWPLALPLIALSSQSRAEDPVSATPGELFGVVHFDAPFVPDSLGVDARDATNTYTAHADATQDDPVLCAAGSPDWCYSMQVESALASSYDLRPIAYINQSSPLFAMGRAPFPVTGPIAIAVGESKLVPTISYTPGEVSGQLDASDMNGQPLPWRSIYVSALDLSNTFPEGCGGSAEFCPFNSVFQGAIGAPNDVAPYRIFLKPGASYQYLSRGGTMNEGALAYSSFFFDAGLHFPTPAAGAEVVDDESFAQAAEITGDAQLALPVYNLQLDLTGYTQTIDPVTHLQLGFAQSYTTTNYYSGLPLPSSTYLNRVFDNADFSRPFSLRPQFFLSLDGTTSLGYPPISLTLSSGEHKVLDFSGTAAAIAGRITFDPPYPAGLYYPSVQAAAWTPTGYGYASTRLATDAQGGTYFMPVFGGDWDYWRFGWSFDLGDPDFTSDFFVGQFLTIPISVADGQTTLHDFVFDTAMVKVFFTAPAGTSISDPHLDVVSGAIVGGVFVPDGREIAHAEGLNQSLVQTAEARVVLRVFPGAAYRVTPSAAINADPNVPGTSRTDFSPFVVTPDKGDVTVVGVPGSLALTVTSPTPGQVFQVCQIPVAGTATGIDGIGITVDGVAVQAPPTGNPDDAQEVGFTTTVAGVTGGNTITVVATAPGQSPVTSVIDVQCSNHEPSVSCPAPSSSECGSLPGDQVTTTIDLSDADGDALTVTWTVDGALVATHTLAGGATSDSLTRGYALGAHTVEVSVDDGKGGGDSCATSVTVEDTSAPEVTATVTQGMLWPPNHDLVDVGLLVSEADTCGESSDAGVYVYSDESDTEETGSGNHSPDAANPAPGTLRLRAERMGDSDGRVYLVIAVGSDSQGGTGFDCTAVVVPHGQSQAAIAAVNAQAAAATAWCEAHGTAPDGFVAVGVGPVIGPKQ